MAPTKPAGGITSSLVFLVIAIVGTAIAPWQLFFQQSCVAEKRLRFSDLKWARLNTLIGAMFTVLVAGTMMLVGNYGYQDGVTFQDPAQFAGAVMPMLGHFARNGILLLMVNAAAGEASILRVHVAGENAELGNRVQIRNDAVLLADRLPRLSPARQFAHYQS